ncbi:TonB-dependent receptor [Cetobacterium sp.]|uniref:TonB-dependent receptor n=1 Tax=Cetobacterium sp. TaxID=2071632 RepID=UPI003F3A1A66
MNRIFLITGLVIVGTLVKAEGKVIKLEESVITSENSLATIGDTPKNITVLTGEEINARGAKTVAEALKLVSNITVREMGGTDAMFDMRGQGATAKSNVILLVDGAPINSIDLSGYKTSSIPVDMIERIEIIPSGGSILYGDGAIGGTINIVTKMPKDKKKYGSFNSEIGSYGLEKRQLIYGTKFRENLFLEIDYLKKEKDGYRNYAKDDLESFGIKSRYKIKDGEIKLKYNYSNTDFRAPGKLNREEVEEDRTQSNEKAWRVNGKTEKNYFVGDYIYNIDSDLELKVLSTFTHERYSSNGSNYKTEIKYLKPQLKYSYFKNSYVVIGGDVYSGDTRDFAYGNGKAEKDSIGGFLVNSYEIERFRFTQGYRRQNIEYNGLDKKKNKYTKKFKEDAVELTGGYSYSDTGSTYISYTTGFRAPNTDEIRAWSGEYKPQKTETYEIGIKDYLGNTYLSSSIFWIKTEDEIFYGRNDSKDEKSNRNLDGISKRKGVEFSFEHYFDKLTISESLTYMKTEFKEGKDIPGIPNVKAVINLNYKFNGKITLNNSWEYYGKMYANGDEENVGRKVDNYMLTGISLSYDFKDGLVVSTGINNLLNKKYYDYVGYDSLGNSYYPAAERNYYLSLKYSF